MRSHLMQKKGGKGAEFHSGPAYGYGEMAMQNYQTHTPDMCPNVLHFGVCRNPACTYVHNAGEFRPYGCMNSQKPSWGASHAAMFGSNMWTAECFLGTWMDAQGQMVNIVSTDAYAGSLLATIARPNLPDRHLQLEGDPMTGNWRCGHSWLDMTQSSMETIVWVSGTGMISMWNRSREGRDDYFASMKETPSWTEPAKVQMTASMPRQRRLSGSTADTCLEVGVENESPDLGRRLGSTSETGSSSDAEYNAPKP